MNGTDLLWQDATNGEKLVSTPVHCSLFLFSFLFNLFFFLKKEPIKEGLPALALCICISVWSSLWLDRGYFKAKAGYKKGRRERLMGCLFTDNERPQGLGHCGNFLAQLQTTRIGPK